MEEIKETNKMKYMLLTVGLGVIAIIGITYALWQMFIVQRETNRIIGGCFDVEITDNNTPINLADSMPMTEAEGRQTTPYQVTITNTCSTYAKYQINAEVINTSTINSKDIRMAIDSGNARKISSGVRITPTIANSEEAYRHYIGNLAPEETITHSVRAWFDENMPPITTSGATYQFKITIIARPDEQPFVCEGCGVLRVPEAALNLGNFTEAVYFYGPIMRKEIESLKFVDHMNIPDGVPFWDVSASQDKSALAWYTDIDGNGLYEVTIGSPGGVLANASSNYLFSEFVNLTSLDITHLYTHNVTTMYYGFSRCRSLENPDLSNLDTSKVKNMSYMFYQYKGLELDLSNFNTSNVTNMSNMFNNATELEKLDVSSFDTSNVTDMRSMFDTFANTSAVLELDLSNFDTSNVEYMSSMFYWARIKSLDISNFDTSKVKNMSHMFNIAFSTKQHVTLDLSSFNTSNVTDMSSMFLGVGQYSPSVTLNLSSFNTSNVTKMTSMFHQAGNMDTTFTLDLRSFDFSSIDISDSVNYNQMLSTFKTANKLTVRNQSAKDFILTNIRPDLTNIVIAS